MIIFVYIFLFLDSSCFCASIRGVNFGGWLLLEPWITPSLFAPFETLPFASRAIDEYTFNLRLGPEEARLQLENHWQTFIRESDFEWLRFQGLTHVRVPFGWWILGDSPSYYHNITYLDLAVDWAEKYDLKILLDLHGAPGSQNGFDNSGVACNSTYYGLLGTGCFTDCPEKPEWITNPQNLDLTQRVLIKLAERYKERSGIWGLGLVNEPFWTQASETLKEWYHDTFLRLRQVVPHWKITMDFSMINFPDIEPKPWTPGFMPHWKEYEGQAILDQHIYLWPFSFVMSEEELLLSACGILEQTSYFKSTNELPGIIGEWSLAFDDCAKWLTGFGSIPGKEKVQKGGCQRKKSDEFYREYAKIQLWMWEKAEGWFFWTYKNELEEEWSWRKLVNNGWVPQNASDISKFVLNSKCDLMKDRLKREL